MKPLNGSLRTIAAWVAALVAAVSVAGTAVAFHMGATAELEQHARDITALKADWKEMLTKIDRIDRLTVEIAVRQGIDVAIRHTP